MADIQKPTFTIELQGNDITAIISPYVRSITYTDNDGFTNKESDEIQIELADFIQDTNVPLKYPKYYFRDNPPARGSILAAKFGYEENLRNAGSFMVDTFPWKQGEDGTIFTIKALAKLISKPTEDSRSAAYESAGLKYIAQQIATKQGLTLDFQGDDIDFSRVTQQQERDLQFLQRMSHTYGFTCKVVNKKLVIHSLDYRLGTQSVYVITPDLVSSIETNITSQPEANVDSDYFDPNQKTTIRSAATTGVKASGSTAHINSRVENTTQSKRVTKAKKTHNKMKENQINITCMGIPNLYAAGNVVIDGYGRNNGEYYIGKVTHKISREGYVCDLELLLNPTKAETTS